MMFYLHCDNAILTETSVLFVANTFDNMFHQAVQIADVWRHIAEQFFRQNPSRCVYFGALNSERTRAHGIGILFYPNGFLYVGEFNEASTTPNAMHGVGVLVYRNPNTFYYGEFNNNLRDGQHGIFVVENQTRYVGSWKFDVSHGMGIRTIADFKYNGQFMNGKSHGPGNAQYPDGSTYKGDFAIGLRHGKGVYVFAGGKGKTYAGEWVNDKMNGMGKLTYGEHGIYSFHEHEGQFVNDLRHGQGIMKFKLRHNLTCNNPDCMHTVEGTWKEDRVDYGTFRCESSNESYTGDFVNLQPHGKGIYKWSSGIMYTGQFHQGKPHGTGVLRLANSDLLHGTFVDGQCHGRGVYTFAIGGHFHGEWNKGRCPEFEQYAAYVTLDPSQLQLREHEFSKHWFKLAQFVQQVQRVQLSSSPYNVSTVLLSDDEGEDDHHHPICV